MPCKNIQGNGMRFTARYTLTGGDGEYRFQFLCAYCDTGYTTGLIQADSIESAQILAEKEAKVYFNGCDRCGKWVCDFHYNMEKALCTECAPLGADCEQLEYLRELGGK